MELLTVNELAEKLKVNRSTIYRYLKEGMPYIQIGGKKYFLLKDVIEWGEKNKREVN